MQILNRVYKQLAYPACFLAIICTACSKDDGPTIPEEGTIAINQTPDALPGAGWIITGPKDQTGTGDATLTGMPTGTYMMAWEDVNGYSTPANEIKTLADKGTLAFNGQYIVDGFVLIQAGTFTMGSPMDEPGRIPEWETQHEVTLTRSFYISKYEVTEERWYQVMGAPPTTSQLPKCYVSFDMAVEFCNALSFQHGLAPAYTINGPNGDVTWNRDSSGYRLPTEAEWEYACRASSQAAFSNGPITYLDCEPLDAVLNEIGWYCGNSSNIQHAVGHKQANAWGLFDTHGNVCEWVWDVMRGDYENLDSVDPVNDVNYATVNRALRGGSWDTGARWCRSASRDAYYGGSLAKIGMRPVRYAE